MSYVSVPFGCDADTCTYCRPGQWMATPWSIAHLVGHGRALCGTNLPTEALQPASKKVRCGLCEVAAARLAAPEPRRVRVEIAEPVPPVRPGPVFAGVDPLVAVLRRYERGEL